MLSTDMNRYTYGPSFCSAHTFLEYHPATQYVLNPGVWGRVPIYDQ
jgi:hypothetical protein